MKKLFTLVALLAMVLGANAKLFTDLEIDYSTYNTDTWNGGYVGKPDATTVEIIPNVGIHVNNPEAPTNNWDLQFQLPGVKSVEDDVEYTMTLKIKGSVAGNIEGGFSGSGNQQIPVTTTEQEVVLTGLMNNPTAQYWANSGALIIQSGKYVGEYWITYIKITHEGKEERPVEWIEMVTNGNAETPWTDDQKATSFEDVANTINICAWAKEKGVNLNDDGGSDPFVAKIVEDPTNASNHVFICDGKPATTEGDASAWDNQFWLMSSKELKVGGQYKVSFRYMASESAETALQVHSQQPSDYLHYHAADNVTFTTTWQTFEETITIPSPVAETPKYTTPYSIAFNLNNTNKNAVKFYFDDISICEMKLDHGFFVAASNTNTGIEYDFDNAIAFEDAGDGLYVATVGTPGKPDTYVNEIMISTVRGNDKMFKASTIKPSGTFIGEDNWDNYVPGSSAKINLQGEGVFTIMLAPNVDEATHELLDGGQLNIVMVEGTKKEFVDIVTNSEVLVVNAVEREYTADEATAAGVETPASPGATWDNQFFIVSNRDIKPGEVTILEFDYVATKDAKSTAAWQGVKIVDDNPAEGYLTGCFNLENDDIFSTTEKHFSKELIVPAQTWDKKDITAVKNISFDLACIKEANAYTFKNVKWYLKSDVEGKTAENLIAATGTTNFKVKIGANTGIVDYGTETGIENVTAKNAKTSTAIYNLAGQRVSNGFKGLVIKDGKKFVK